MKEQAKICGHILITMGPCPSGYFVRAVSMDSNKRIFLDFYACPKQAAREYGTYGGIPV